MMMCWNEDPRDRPSFSDMVKLLDNRMSTIAGYLDVGYNPFILIDYDSLDHPEYSRIEELPLTEALAAPVAAAGNSQARGAERKKPLVKPRTKKPTIHITQADNETNSVADSGHYY